MRAQEGQLGSREECSLMPLPHGTVTENAEENLLNINVALRSGIFFILAVLGGRGIFP